MTARSARVSVSNHPLITRTPLILVIGGNVVPDPRTPFAPPFFFALPIPTFPSRSTVDLRALVREIMLFRNYNICDQGRTRPRPFRSWGERINRGTIVFLSQVMTPGLGPTNRSAENASRIGVPAIGIAD